MDSSELFSSPHDMQSRQMQRLKSAFPEVFTEDGRVDWDKLRLSLGESIEVEQESFGMNWPGKSDCFAAIHQAAASVLVPQPEKYSGCGDTQNTFVEGDNLEALKLLQAAYAEKIKMIYIDPPYNTGNDFVYSDNYAEHLSAYRSSGRSHAGTKPAETDGRFHSKWMNMMYPRLFLARKLLKEDGIIFISINDAEADNLRKICNEIFGESNFIAQLVWANKEGGGGSDSKHFRIKHEYILCYARNKEKAVIQGVGISNKERYTQRDDYFERRGPYYLQKLNQASIQYSPSLDYPILAPDGRELHPAQGAKRACWRWSKEKFAWGLEMGFILFKKDRSGAWQVYTKQYLRVNNEDRPIERTNRPSGIIEEFSSTQASKELESLTGFRIFSYPKPVGLLKFLMSLLDLENEYVLDFFAGSGTTGQAVLELQAAGKKVHFILVQLPESTNPQSIARSKGFETISQITVFRLQKAIQQIQSGHTPDTDAPGLGFRVFRLEKREPL